MNKLFDVFFQEDLLEGIHKVVRSSNFDILKTEGRQEDIKISASLLIILVLLVALGRSIYGRAEFSFLQHFIASFVVIFFSYIITGLFLSLAVKKIALIHHFFRCLITCLFVSISLYLILFPTTEVLNRIGFIMELSLFPQANGLFADFFPALVFSAAGCLLVYLLMFLDGRTRRGVKIKRRISLRVINSFLLLYLFLTSSAFYFLIVDRGVFFGSYMSQISGIQFK